MGGEYSLPNSIFRYFVEDANLVRNSIHMSLFGSVLELALSLLNHYETRFLGSDIRHHLHDS